MNNINHLCSGYFCFFGGYELCRHLLTPPGKSKDEIGILYTNYVIAVFYDKVTQETNYRLPIARCHKDDYLRWRWWNISVGRDFPFRCNQKPSASEQYSFTAHDEDALPHCTDGR